ncbi:DivIVA domain-containing protein [Glycomyces sp. L485]|uniref:DivIVA domain-containing protein n=1 Tax=Glycomyces sp. L485 TaxID=2909235 RepID=UPI00321A5123
MASHGDRFRRRALSRGYKVDEVDAFLDRVEATLAGEPVGSPVTADEVDDVVFRVRFGGYDEWQVDVYLDRVARQLAELEERGVLGTAPAPDYGKPDSTAAAAAVPPPQQAPGQRRSPDPDPTQAIPARDIMAAHEAAPPPPPPAREPVGRAARAAAAPPEHEGFGDLRGDDGEGFGFLAAPPGDDYEDPFAKRGGADDAYGANPRGGAPEPAMPQQGGDFGAPRDPEPAAGRGGDFGPQRRDPAPPRAGGQIHDAPQAGSSPHGATEQLPLQSDPRRGAFPPPDGPSAGGYGPPPSNDDTQIQPAATGAAPPGRRAAPDPAPGFGAAYDDETSDTGRRAAAPPLGPSSQPPMPPTPQGPPTGPIQQGGPRQPMSQGVPPAPPTAPIQQSQQIPPQGEAYGARARGAYGRDGYGSDAGYQPEPQAPQHDGFAPEGHGPEDTGFGRRAAPPSPPPAAGGFGGPPGHVSGPPAGDNGVYGAPAQSDNGVYGAPPQGGYGAQPQNDYGGYGAQPQSDNGVAYGAAPQNDNGVAYGGATPPPQPPRGAAAPPDFGRRNPYEGRGAFEAPGRHGREEMTTEMRASDSPFTSDDVQRLEQLRRAFQPRRFGSGYDPSQVDQMFDAVSAAMTGRNAVPLSDRELDTSQFSLVQGGYFEAEVDSALREVRELFARRGMMH